MPVALPVLAAESAPCLRALSNNACEAPQM
jgi:hypothetical protein